MFVLVSSRNNYNLFEEFFLSKNNIPLSKLINCDAGSNKKNKIIGRKICEKNKIIFFEPKNNSVQLILSEIIDELKNKSSSNWLLCLHTDSYLKSEDYYKLVKMLNNEYFDKFGLIGLNTIFWPHTKKFEEINFEEHYFGLMGKSILSNVNYSVYGPHTIKENNDIKEWNNLVAVESIMDIGYLINMNKFKKYIVPSNNFPFVCAIDDIGMQFLKNNIYNVTLPNIYCIHDPWIKNKYKMPVSSPKNLSKKFNDKYYNDDLSYNMYWKKKWKFDRQFKTVLRKPIVNNNILKKTYTVINNFFRQKKVTIDDEIRTNFKNTLIHKFINHHKNTPVLIFDEFKKLFTGI